MFSLLCLFRCSLCNPVRRGSRVPKATYIQTNKQTNSINKHKRMMMMRWTEGWFAQAETTDWHKITGLTPKVKLERGREDDEKDGLSDGRGSMGKMLSWLVVVWNNSLHLCVCVCECVASLCLLSDLCSYRWSDVSGEGIRTRENDGEEGRGDSGNPTSSFQSG